MKRLALTTSAKRAGPRARISDPTSSAPIAKRHPKEYAASSARTRCANATGTADGTYTSCTSRDHASIGNSSGGSGRSGGVGSIPKPGLSNGKYVREYREYGSVLQSPSVCWFQMSPTPNSAIPARRGTAAGRNVPISINLRRMTNPSGAASATIVNGLASKPHARAAATPSRWICFPDSSQRTVAAAAASHMTVVVLSER